MRRHILLIAVIALITLAAAPALAQTNTPVPPTPTAVGLSVDTNEFFTQTNSWIDVFTPIVAIGVGIAIALAILTFIGNQILKAFRSSGGSR